RASWRPMLVKRFLPP
ncbi:hypothetical protein D018_3770B, partial [Vibrio parahaemolyticus VP2007-007]